MTCDEAHLFLHAYIDDELDPATAIQVENHLPGCPDCQMELEAARAIGRAAAQPGVCHRAPSELRDRLKMAIRAEVANREATESMRMPARRWLQPMAYSGWAAALLLAVGMIVMYSQFGASRGQVDELVSAHVRSLEAQHLLDVASTDQHTVKPWFTGKIDFAPPIVDLAERGFPLVGGRLDYLGQQKVAALIYRRNKHIINLFIWPGEGSTVKNTKQGFSLIRFEFKGMVCWAVSDLNPLELQQFVDLFKGQKSAATRS